MNASHGSSRAALRATAALLASLAAGCAAVDPDPDWIARDVAVRPPLPAIAAPASFAPGIDATDAALGLRRGDHVLFGLVLDVHGERREWLVRVEVLDPKHEVPWGPPEDGFRLLFARVEAMVLDGHGALLGRDELMLSAGDLLYGLAQACRRAADPDAHVAKRVEAASEKPKGPFGKPPETVRASLALRNLMKVVRESEVLYGVLYEVIDKPSLWSVITNLGVRPSTADHFDRARSVDPFVFARPGEGAAEARVPAWEVPVELFLNKAPALRSVVTVVDPHSPFGLCAGVVALRAFRPSDPKVTFTLRLLAARRGPEDPP